MGSDFVKKVGPVGIILILVISAAGIILSYTADLGVPERYYSKQNTEYYAQNADTMNELLAELREFVFPSLDGITQSYLSEGGGVIVIFIDEINYNKVRAVILRDFDESFFEFHKSGEK